MQSLFEAAVDAHDIGAKHGVLSLGSTKHIESIDLPVKTSTQNDDAELILNRVLQRSENLARFTLVALGNLLNTVHPDPAYFVSYLQRVFHITEASFPTVAYALKYLCRLYEKYPHLSGKTLDEVGTQTATRKVIKSETVMSMFTTALILANHFLEDHAYTNKTWGEVCHIELEMINITQAQFLALIDHRLHITEEQWKQWCSQMLGIYGTLPGNFWVWELRKETSEHSLEHNETSLKRKCDSDEKESTFYPSPMSPEEQELRTEAIRKQHNKKVRK